jgi:ubiquinone/menaquinone biosynthesis C-methylase UbiE
MEKETVLSYFNSDPVVAHYEAATEKVGLWKSEEKIFQQIFKLEDSLLELGCGVGRISFGLHELGYKHLLATDYAKNMIQRARALSKRMGYPVPFRVCDATGLEFEDAVFEGVIFGFNGLMQIPKESNRVQALKEIYRVLKKNGLFVFTTHLRSNAKYQAYWEEQKSLWAKGEQRELLDDFGDRYEPTDMGDVFIHVPEQESMEALVKAIGFQVEIVVPRSIIANEDANVREFSDDCAFWILRK